MFRIGVDIGGTFTDCVLVNEETGAAVLHKLLTTPEDPSDAVLDGVGILLAAGERYHEVRRRALVESIADDRARLTGLGRDNEVPEAHCPLL